MAKLGDVAAHNRTTCDLGDADQLRNVIRATRPDLIVNAVAYTAVDKAETDAALCHRINAEAPGILAEEAKALGAWLIHYSTDYVFDGSKTAAYAENDPPSPLSVYGRSKLAGDDAIASALPDHSILRVSWVYGVTGRNFAKTILKLASERDELRIVADQFGAPTSAELIAETTAEIIARYLASPHRGNAALARGIFNLAPSGRTSWHHYAVELVREAERQGWPLKLSEDRIIPISTEDYPTPAARPRNSLLDTTKLRHLLGYDLPQWQTPLREFIAQLHDVNRQA
ncbi:dTDP-4-dehydrorhamnose reductase [[Pseudomonas] carboxydohydrogena]|uniref:dTDP-4-dehydrorhamnose reductase n=1 Tax=Afipia carboxydohydrogena TaxID=290 RepID=UPI003B83729B